MKYNRSCGCALRILQRICATKWTTDSVNWAGQGMSVKWDGISFYQSTIDVTLVMKISHWKYYITTERPPCCLCHPQMIISDCASYSTFQWLRCICHLPNDENAQFSHLLVVQEDNWNTNHEYIKNMIFELQAQAVICTVKCYFYNGHKRPLSFWFVSPSPLFERIRLRVVQDLIIWRSHLQRHIWDLWESWRYCMFSLAR